MSAGIIIGNDESRKNRGLCKVATTIMRFSTIPRMT
jgi:hypothetical protein